jgi:hypothetical protein
MTIGLKKLYYKYIDTTAINHYRLLLLTEEFITIGTNYFDKYPTAQGWINMNKTLFEFNKNAEAEYKAISKRQTEITNQFFENQKKICENDTSKKCKICSDYFQSFFVSKKYHYTQFPNHVKMLIKSDIEQMTQN